jgi:hypothetical protein
MDLQRNESSDCDGISDNKKYLHTAVCNVLFLYLSTFSTHLTIANGEKQEGKVTRKRMQRADPL